MDAARLGRSLRAIRIRLDLTQLEVAGRAGVSRSYVGNVERGLIAASTFGPVERICRCLGADLDVRVRWRGEGLDRLLDEAHADLVEVTVRRLRATGWKTAGEVTFNHYGDRGSVDVLGWFPATLDLLIVEVKSVVADAQGTMMPLDRKARLGMEIGRGLGWRPDRVSRLLVVADTSANRRRVERVSALFEAAFPLRGRAVSRWLRRPAGAMSGLMFLPESTRPGARRRSTGRQRVRRGSNAVVPSGNHGGAS